MKKNVTKIVALTAAAAMLASSLAACGNNGAEATSEAASSAASSAASTSESAAAPAETSGEANTALARDWYPENFDTEGWTDESSALYDETLGEYYEYYQEAMAADNVAERTALFAIAEAKLLGSGVMIPTRTRGGQYAMSRVAPRSVNTTLWGSDSDRFHNAIVATEFITAEDRDAIKDYWNEHHGDGTFEQWCRDYLTGAGYTLSDTYSWANTSDPVTWTCSPPPVRPIRSSSSTPMTVWSSMIWRTCSSRLWRRAGK